MMNSRVFFKKSNRYSTYLGALLAIILSAGTVFAQDPASEDKAAEKTAASADVADEKKDAKEDSKAAKPAEKPPAELTEEQREVAEMMEIVQDFKEQTKAYKKEVQQLVERKYDQQRKAVVGSFNRAITDLEKEENERRAEAIKVFEKFLSKYPDAPEYTPGALWRLAELYYERSKIEYTKEEDNYDAALAVFNDGASEVEPTPPAPHFERTISLLQRLVQDFPDYKLIDGSYYLMAYCLQEQGEPEEAQASYVTFTRRFPKSKFLPEVWTRLGESYFEDPHKLDQAIESYKNVLSYPDSRMYDKALYKLAWTYYKVDRFDEAVEKFDHLISWADKDKDKADGDVSRTELRKESMQYLAISFAEDEWQGSGVANASAYFQKLGGRSYDGEFFRKLGEVYYIDAKYDKSIDAYREAIKRYPLDPINPTLMASVVDSYYRMQQPDKATQAQEELVAAFGPGTRWREANKNEADAILEADKLAENALYTAAVRHHTLAQRFKEQERPEEARQEYAKAAAVYSDYMNRFKDSRDSYKLRYYLAECYYYSLDFEKAAVAYADVRDSVEGTEFLADSANAVVLSYINLIKEAEEAGRLPALTIYTSKDRPKELELKPREIPPLRKKLIEASDAFIAKLPKDEQVDNMIFRSARVLYGYDHFDPARERFSQLVADSKDNDMVTSSINLIIESYLVTQDWQQVENWSRKLAKLSRDPTQKKALKEFELGARFNKANGFMTSGKKLSDDGRQEEAQDKLDEAAKEFIRLVDDDPKGKTSDKALNNAALCYTWSNRPMSAGKVYERIVKEYPSSDFADQALFLMAASAEGSYQFQRAINNYLKLVNEYPKSKFRSDSLYNAAVALEGDQQYRKAAKSFERYAKLFKEREDAGDNFFRAGKVLEKAKAWKDEIALFSRFIKTYRRDSSQAEKIVAAQGKIAEAWAKRKDSRKAKSKAKKSYWETVKLYNRYKLSPGGVAAEATARAKFMLTEMELPKYENITFAVHPRKLEKTLKYKAETLKKMEEKYKTVFKYKRVQWTLAAYYRLGYLYENFANVLVNAPCPRGLNEEECDIYKGKLEDFAEAPIRKAVQAFQETMEKSKSFKFVNEWTEKAYASLNRFEPLQFPLQKKPANALVLDRYGPLPMLRAAETGIKPSGK